MDSSSATPAAGLSSSIEATTTEPGRISRWLNRISGRDDSSQNPTATREQGSKSEADANNVEPAPVKPSLGRRLSRKVVPGLPRPATFRRQHSERRERLKPCEPECHERQSTPVDRRRAMSARPASPRPIPLPKLSAPAVYGTDGTNHSQSPLSPQHDLLPARAPDPFHQTRPAPPPSPPPDDDVPTILSEKSFEDEIDQLIKSELEEKWILNLSMHFRDQSPREKFFVTYAETPTKWRRVTISCDYRNAPLDSLERDLQALTSQRMKSARIYEAIRTSLPNIQFYDTVTNLKLETGDSDRLHVHVTEDSYETIPYPSTCAVQHLNPAVVSECDVHFVSHMSGFVYKVQVAGRICIKKEIPGPDSVDEFLYEVNVLHSLIGTENVIQFQGLVVDPKKNLIKGLLIGYAQQGPLVDILFDYKDQLGWARREQWAKQIVHGLSEIHEAGFVQGDFTLSNIVVDDHDRAQIIDINRRGCPMGWEPPEIDRLIRSGQRISMYIGVKSDLFQLGMVLWALAREQDEPERQPRPLSLHDSPRSIPPYYRRLTDLCLSPLPRDRPAAKVLLGMFPQEGTTHPPIRSPYSAPNPQIDSVPDIDPAQAVAREDLDLGQHPYSREISLGSHTYIDHHGSIEFPFDGPGSYMVSYQGRQPSRNTQHLASQNRSRDPDSEPPNGDFKPQIVPVSPDSLHKWQEIEMNGKDSIVQRECSDLDDENHDDGFPRRGRSIRRANAVVAFGPDVREILTMPHVDSGLADMDNFAGIGGHETLRICPSAVMVEELDFALAGDSLLPPDDAHHEGVNPPPSEAV